MKENVNSFIIFLERLVAFILNLIWIPSFITPPNNTPVDFVTEDWYILSGKYNNGKYNYYPAKYDTVRAWRFRGHVTFPKLRVVGKSFNVTFLFSPKSDNVWEYKDLAGKKHHVSYNTRKLLEKNPFNTTVEDKNTRIKEQTEKARMKKHAKVKAIKGNTL